MAFCIPRKPLSRRTLLRGMGAGAMLGVGLPRLEAMLNGNGTAYAQGAPLGKRFGVWFWGNGVIVPRWVPEATGTGDAWQLSEQLSLYTNIKQNVTVVTGLEIKMDGQVHHIGPAGALTGYAHDGQNRYQTPTIDHQIANLIGQDSPFRSLVVGVSRATANGQGQTVNYASSSAPGAAVEPEYDARALFDRLFGQGGNTPDAPDRSFTSRRRVLDVVMDDAAALSMKLGATDRARLDQHLQGIQELEARLEQLENGGFNCSDTGLDPSMIPETPVDQPNLGDQGGEVTNEQNLVMAQLVTYALACDLTNAFMFQHGKPAAHYNMSVIGINEDIHDDISHVEAGDQPVMHSAMMYWFEQCRVFMELMQNTPDGEGNLLENSLVYGTSDVSFGYTHSIDEYPAILFGRAGGLIKGDQHVRMEGENMSRLLYTLVNLYGADVTEFGGGEGQVTSGIPDILV